MFVHLLIAFVVMSSVCIMPSSSFGYYIIFMKNGRELSTSQYWQEQDRIMFYVYNGVMGVENEFVEKIVKKDPAENEEVVVVMPQSPANEQNDTILSGKMPSGIPSKEMAKLEQTNPIKPVQQEPQQPDEYTEEFRKIKEEFKNITFMTTEEIYEFSDRLTAFKKKIIKNDVAHVYQQQFMEAYTIGDQMEAVLNAGR